MTGDYIVSLANKKDLPRVSRLLKRQGFELSVADEYPLLFLVKNKPKCTYDDFKEVIGMTEKGKLEGAIVQFDADYAKNPSVSIYSHKNKIGVQPWQKIKKNK